MDLETAEKMVFQVASGSHIMALLDSDEPAPAASVTPTERRHFAELRGRFGNDLVPKTIPPSVGITIVEREVLFNPFTEEESDEEESDEEVGDDRFGVSDGEEEREERSEEREEREEKQDVLDGEGSTG